jgi:hypothetical protein
MPGVTIADGVTLAYDERAGRDARSWRRPTRSNAAVEEFVAQPAPAAA